MSNTTTALVIEGVRIQWEVWHPTVKLESELLLVVLDELMIRNSEPYEESMVDDVVQMYEIMLTERED